MALLATSLPDGIMVKTFEDRMASGLLGTQGVAWVQMSWGLRGGTATLLWFQTQVTEVSE